MRYEGPQRVALWPAAFGPWQLFMAALFALHINYVPFHLATENHLGGENAPALTLRSTLPADNLADHDDPDRHSPHSVSDHSCLLVRQAPSCSVDPEVTSPHARVELVLKLERSRPLSAEPDKPPNTPLLDRPRPRAPPLT